MSSTVRDPGRPPSPEAFRSADLLTVAARPSSPSAVVCAVSGEVDMWTAPDLRDRLLERIRRAGPDLVVDLGEVVFFGAAGLTVLVEVQTAADAAGVGFFVVARTRTVLLPLTVTGLGLAFDVYPHVDDVPLLGGIPDQQRHSVEHGHRRPTRSPMVRLPDSP